MHTYELKCYVGQLVEHKKFGYRGVVYDVDAEFTGTDEWYESVAKSRPPKNAPWYHVLVDGNQLVTYVAERHLQASSDYTPIQHELIDIYFCGFKNNQYIVAGKQ